jgi:single-strand DNA-binding protein
MNNVILMGRLTKDPDVRYTADNKMAVARYTLAVDRRIRRDNNDQNAQTADFPSIIAFGKSAEFAEKYLHKGTKILVTGRLQTGKYTNRNGQTVYTTDVIADQQEFCENKNASPAPDQQQPGTEFQQVAEDEKLPWE